jgi:hypothetical protein
MKDKASEARWETVKEEMRDVLIQFARDKQTVTYSELTRMLQTTHIHYHSHILVRLLDELGNEEDSEGRPCLPALVVTKQTGMPGGGFFAGLSTQVNQSPDALEEYWRSRVDEVFEYWTK